MSDHQAFSAGNVAVITGAADGIGYAAAKRFATAGLHVLMADINTENLATAVATVSAMALEHGTRVESRIVDVSKFDDVKVLKDTAMSTFGRVDVLMNNAGTSVKTTSWSALELWQHLIGVNMWGVIHGIQAFTEMMIAQTSPSIIINTGSKQGITNPPGNPAYNVSKAGVKAATESLQHALRNTENCQVSAHLLVPGYTFTGLTKAKEKPAGAWSPEQVIDYLIEAVNQGSFYIICPDNEVSSAEDSRRILWAAGDLVHNRVPLSRWDAAYEHEYDSFEVT
jgi:NAD(P)-dependent dehydrogenase (short-subunit alcohol dehydrogenase family)